MSSTEHATLPITFHGRIIDHFGIEMYQKPVAAIAELVSNSWDADAETVCITVPETIAGTSAPTIVIKDDGIGMTFEDCRTRYLHIGYNTRGNDPARRTPGKNRPVLGRKGIGKFAGFGIARIVRVVTVSEATGEKTVFEMDAEELRGDGTSYVDQGHTLPVLEYLPPDDDRRSQHGTTITLRSLLLGKGMSPGQFGASMARRFLLHQRSDDFAVTVNGLPLPEGENLENAEFVFPRDYRDEELPDGLVFQKEGDDARAWGRETLPGGESVEWRFVFFKSPVHEDELRGIAVFTNEKLAQSPFLFNLTGGLGGQQGVEYLHGRVEAGYLDRLPDDVIAPERQRINWEHSAAEPLQKWGQDRVKSLLRLWQHRRAEGKTNMLDAKIGQLGVRLARLQAHERRTVEQALKRVALVSKISNDQFLEIGNSILLSWEHGKLRSLVLQLADSETLDEAQLLKVLLESQVLTALHTLEAVEARVKVIDGLSQRIAKREPENPLRDYIAENPWLISPMWDLFAKETTIPRFIEVAREDARLDDLDGFKKRVDLVLSGSGTLLIVEFMAPGKGADFDHLFRFHTYVSLARKHISTSTAGDYSQVLGYLIADRLDKKGAIGDRVEALARERMLCMDWHDLLDRARRQWRHYFEVLVARAPDDFRVDEIRRRHADNDEPVESAALASEG